MYVKSIFFIILFSSNIFASENTVNWDIKNLPVELLLTIIKNLDSKSLCSLFCSSKYFQQNLFDFKEVILKKEEKSIQALNDFTCLSKEDAETFINIIYGFENNIDDFFNNIYISNDILLPIMILYKSKHYYGYTKDYEAVVPSYFYNYPDALWKANENHSDIEFITGKKSQILELFYALHFFYKNNYISSENNVIAPCLWKENLQIYSNIKSTSDIFVFTNFFKNLFFKKNINDCTIDLFLEKFITSCNTGYKRTKYKIFITNLLSTILSDINSNQNYIYITENQSKILDTLLFTIINPSTYRYKREQNTNLYIPEINKYFTDLTNLIIKENLYELLLGFYHKISTYSLEIPNNTKKITKRILELCARCLPVLTLTKHRNAIDSLNRKFKTKLLRESVIGLFENYLRYAVSYTTFNYDQMSFQEYDFNPNRFIDKKKWPVLKDIFVESNLNFWERFKHDTLYGKKELTEITHSLLKRDFVEVDLQRYFITQRTYTKENYNTENTEKSIAYYTKKYTDILKTINLPLPSFDTEENFLIWKFLFNLQESLKFSIDTPLLDFKIEKNNSLDESVIDPNNPTPNFSSEDFYIKRRNMIEIDEYKYVSFLFYYLNERMITLIKNNFFLGLKPIEYDNLITLMPNEDIKTLINYLKKNKTNKFNTILHIPEFKLSPEMITDDNLKLAITCIDNGMKDYFKKNDFINRENNKLNINPNTLERRHFKINLTPEIKTIKKNPDYIDMQKPEIFDTLYIKEYWSKNSPEIISIKNLATQAPRIIKFIKNY